MQLLISNVGEAPVESFTLLGASGSRGDSSLIGQFGSGAKLALTTLIRKGLNVTVYSGLTRMCFKTEAIEIEGREEQQVYIQFGGTSTKKLRLGWVLGFGAMDWKDESMSLREFIANAIDRVNRDGGDLDTDMRVELVPDRLKKAQSGQTRVFIEANDAVKDYVDDLPRRFLHFSDLDPTQTMLPKRDRPKAQVYYNGVWVCELGNTGPSLCDYNFTGSQIEIDESRNLNEYSARAAIGNLYQNASVDELARVFSALSRGEVWLETALDGYNIQSNSWENEHDQRCQNWRDAWAQVHGEDAVACQCEDMYSKAAKRKGHTLGVVTSAWLDTVLGYGIQTASSVLSDDERDGRVFHPPTTSITAAVDEVWEWIRAVGLDSKDKPSVGSFTDDDEDSTCLNLCRDGEIFLRRWSLEGDAMLEETLEVLAKYLDNDSLIKQVLIRWMT